MTRVAPVDRYHTDPHFRRIVDSLYMLFDDAQFTPTEIREAAMLAQIKYEELRLKPLLLETGWPDGVMR